MPTMIRATRSFPLAQPEKDELERINARRKVIESDIKARMLKTYPELEPFISRAEMKLDANHVHFNGNAEVDEAVSPLKPKPQFIDPQTQRVLLQGKLLSLSEKRRMMQSMGIELDPEQEPGDAPVEGLKQAEA